MTDTTETQDVWHFWREALAGRQPQANPDNPQCGFYREARRQEYMGRRTFTPVAYYPSEKGVIRCRYGTEDFAGDSKRAQMLWNFVHTHPVTELLWRNVVQGGQPWPDEASLVEDDNRPPSDEPDNFDTLKDRIENLSREAKRLLEGEPIATQDEADNAANLADRLAELWAKADALRKEDRKPHDEGLRVVQARWAPLLTAAEAYKNLKYKLLTPWLTRQRKAAEEADTLAAAAGEPVTQTRPKAGTRGRAMSLRIVKTANVKDWDEAYKFFRENPDVRGVLQGLSDKAVRAGVVLTFATVTEEEKAV